MSARERREKHPRPPSNPPGSPGKAAKMAADRLDYYDEAMGNLVDLDNRDLTDMLGQLATYLARRIERTRIQLVVDDHFGKAKTNFDRHEANLARLQRNQHQAVSLLKLINMFGDNRDLAREIVNWAFACGATLLPEEGS